MSRFEKVKITLFQFEFSKQLNNWIVQVGNASHACYICHACSGDS